MTDYPQHEKLATVKDLSQEIGTFLEWTEEQGWHLGEWDENGFGDQQLFLIGLNRLDILARYFKIDLDVLETEKRHMLEAQRVSNEEFKRSADKIIDQYTDTLKDLKDQ